MTPLAPLVYLCGPAIEDAAEKAFLKKLVETLEQAGKPSLVIVQPCLQKCTPDFLIVMEGLVAVIDIKTCAQPITGEVEGDWQQGFPGAYKGRYSNLLRTLKGHKDALCNGMQLAAKTQGLAQCNFHQQSTALAVFWHDWHPKSKFPCFIPNCPEWYRVLSSAEFFERLFKYTHQCPWTLEDWKVFAELQLKARLLSSVEAAMNPALLNAERQIEVYRQRSGAAFELNLPALVEQESFKKQLEAEERSGGVVYLQGPSGTGKSIRLQDSAARLTRQGYVVIMIYGETYRDGLEAEIEKATAGWTDRSLPRLLQCIPAQSTTRVALLVDALNVVPLPLQRKLIAEIAQLQPLFHLILLTGQSSQPDPEQRLRPRALELPRIRGAYRQQIFNSLLTAETETQAVHPLMQLSEDGFTLRAIAESSKTLLPGASMRDAFDNYVRGKLPQPKLELSLRILRRLALHMQQEFVQAIKQDDFLKFAKTICEEENEKTAIIDELRCSGVLRQEAPFIRFIHERIQVFLAAEELAIMAEPSDIDISGMLRKPENWIYTDFVYGRERDMNLDLILRLKDHDLPVNRLGPAFRGVYGTRLKNEVKEHIQKLFEHYQEYLLTSSFSPYLPPQRERERSERKAPRLGDIYVQTNPVFELRYRDQKWLKELIKYSLHDRALFDTLLATLAQLETKLIECYQAAGLTEAEARERCHRYPLKQLNPELLVLPHEVQACAKRHIEKNDLLPIDAALPALPSIARLRMFQKIRKADTPEEIRLILREAIGMGSFSVEIITQIRKYQLKLLKEAAHASPEIFELIALIKAIDERWFTDSEYQELQSACGVGEVIDKAAELRRKALDLFKEVLSPDFKLPEAIAGYRVPGHSLFHFLEEPLNDGFEAWTKRWRDPWKWIKDNWESIRSAWHELDALEQGKLLRDWPTALIYDAVDLPELIPMLCATEAFGPEELLPLFKICPQKKMHDFTSWGSCSPQLQLAWHLGVSNFRILSPADFDSAWLAQKPHRSAFVSFCALVQVLARQAPDSKEQARELCLELHGEHPFSFSELLLLLAVSARKHAGLERVEKDLLAYCSEVIAAHTVHALAHIHQQVPLFHSTRIRLREKGRSYHHKFVWTDPEESVSQYLLRTGEEEDTELSEEQEGKRTLETAIVEYWDRFRHPAGIPILKGFVKEKTFKHAALRILRKQT